MSVDVSCIPYPTTDGLRYSAAAHINRYTGRKEPVVDHLELSASLAREYAEKIKMPGTAETTVRGHDVAKMTEKYQGVLQKTRIRINHAAPSAAVTYKILKEQGKLKDPEKAAIVYNLIKGHHEGLLSSYYFDGESFEYDIDDDIDYWLNDYGARDGNGKENALGSDDEKEKILSEAGEILSSCLFDENELSWISDIKNEDRMIAIRLLFSCCVDADYTSSAFASDSMPIPDEEVIDPREMLARLEEYHEKIVSGAKDTPINRLRNYVYECSEKSGEKAGPGMYTMTAPTGLGKTLAMILWGLKCAERNGQDRIFIVLPFLSIIQQNVKVYRDIFGDSVVIEDDSVTDFNEETKLMAERWNAKLIITTNVKFFETMFSNRPSTLRRLHRIANSVVIFDESQSLPSNVADITINTLTALKRHNTSVLFSTATPPAYEFRSGIDNYLKNTKEVIPEPQELYDRYAEARKIKIKFCRKSYSSKSIAAMFADEKQALYIVNTKSKTERLSGVLEDVHGKESVFVLTTDMCTADRDHTIKEVRKRLKNGQKVHLVSTQCIEAGVDLDFPCGMREFGPLTSVIQALGRIGREGKGSPWAVICGVESEYGGYPSDQYRHETGATKQLIKKCQEAGTDFNINSLEEIRAYYKEIFAGDADESRDKKELADALEELNFQDVSENYRIIEEKDTVNIIVPYGGRIDLYDRIVRQLQESSFCINKRIMKDAHDITVSVYRTKKGIINGCQQLYLRGMDGIYETNWLLMDVKSGYTDGRGITEPKRENIL